jgi:hypothetical protein
MPVTAAPLEPLPELGPYLGRLADPAPRFDPEAIKLDDVRLALVTDLFERARATRDRLAAADVTGARMALGRTAWLELWNRAVDGAAAEVLAAVDHRVQFVGKTRRLSPQRIRALLPDPDDRAVLRARLEAAGIELEELIAAAPPERGDRWVETVARLARELEASWDRLEAVAREEIGHWERRLAALPAPGPARWQWVVAALAALIAGWLGLGIGGYLTLPSWLDRLRDWFWSLPWP